MSRTTAVRVAAAVLAGALPALTARSPASAPRVASTPMNGAAPHGMYRIANPPEGKSPYVPLNISHRGKYIEVYSPNISTHYSEVFWTMMPSVPLPAEFVQKHAGKVVAFTGYEVDAVRAMPDGSEQHVPLYDQYNHHHNAYLLGSAARLVDVGPAGSRTAPTHGGVRPRWEPRDVPKTSAAKASERGLPRSEIPTSHWIVDGNGGEYRMSLHGTARGSAMLLDSPETFRVEPMMINSNGGGGGSKGQGPGHWTLFPSGAYGRARGATMPEKSLYSPLLECPCTDRKKKIITYHNTLETGVCSEHIATAAECFQAVADLALAPTYHNTTITSATQPQGCFVMSTEAGYEAYFNLAASSTQCGLRPGAHLRSAGAESVSGVDLHLDLDEGAAGNCSRPAVTRDLAGVWSYNGEVKGKPYSSPYKVSFVAVQGKPGQYELTGGPCANGCSASVSGSSIVVDFSTNSRLTATISGDFGSMLFSNSVPWTKDAQACPGVATITISGPSTVWFGVGFDANTMADKPYAIIVDGAGKLSERRMGDHDAGAQIAPSVRLVNSSVANGRRTLVLTRPLLGASTQHFSFQPGCGGLPFIAAVGSGSALAYHKARSGGTLMLVEAGAPLCVCPSFGTASGSIDGVTFNNHCAGSPRSTLKDNHNDICDITTYEGGLKCCSHKSILLDSNQTVPPQLDTFRMKFRFYYEEFDGTQQNAFFMFVINSAGAGEYDIPQQCSGKPGEPSHECVHTLTGNFKVRDSMHKCVHRSDAFCSPGWDENKSVALLRAGTHCHAPACINETLWNMDTVPPTPICYNEPLYGNGTFPQSGQSFNEEGYAVGIPPCFWGSAAEGLRTPPVLSLNTNLRSVKHVNSTFYHYGVMAQWQMRGMWVDRKI